MKKLFLFLTICSIQIVFSQGKPYNDDVKTIKGGPINVPEITNTEKNQLGIQIEKESFNNNGSEFQGTNDGIIDGVFIKENIPSKRVLAEEPVREADVTFQRRLWRDIDLREKSNQCLYFPLDVNVPMMNLNKDNATEIFNVVNPSKLSLWSLLKKLIENGQVIPFNTYGVPEGYLLTPSSPKVYDGDQFKYPIKPFTNGRTFTSISKSSPQNELEKSYSKRIIACVGFQGEDVKVENPNKTGEDDQYLKSVFKKKTKVKNPSTGIEEEIISEIDSTESPLAKFFTTKDIIAYHLKEDWFFDKERSQFEVRVIGIAPVIYDTTGGDGAVIGKRELFWLYFPNLRKHLVNYYLYNPKNDAQWMSFDDYFRKRLFTSTIYQATNIKDASIDKFKSGVDALYESQKITDELRDWEHDLWQF